jgi:S1-C subfamily serine protease
MKLKLFKPVIWMGVLIMIVSLACNLGSNPTSAPSTQPPAQTQAVQAPTQPPPPTQAAVATQEPAAPSGAVTDLQNVKSAVIQIESQGSFIDPQFGVVLNGAGRGSGFIIDPSGIAVTNNHVVTGAGLLKVWIGGDTSKTYNAKVLGVSECSDLAVIDIDGEGFPYLQWHDGGIEVGTDMYLAGFPLGEPEYSLTKGVVSKAKADGETSWASVDSVIEYDATSNPGNSGGPVIDTSGKVMAIHYAGNSSTRQAFGISKDIAEGVIDQLRSGKNVDSIGVNGQAVSNDDGSLTGVWVSSVQPGSPADKAGIQPGDIITMLGDLLMAQDGTMSQYCDVLRSHNPTDTISVEVLRWASGEVLDGQLNGRELAVTATTGGSTGSSGSTSSGSSGSVNPNASQSGDLYYTTEFDSGLSDWVYFLTSGQDDNFTASTDNSKLHVDIEETRTFIYFINDQLSVGDVRLDTKAENLGRNNNNVSLICRYSDQGWYEFNVWDNGEYDIYYYDNVVKKDYKLLFSGGSTLIKTGKDTNEYTAICQGDKLTLGVNGVEVRTVKDSSLKDGEFGFGVSSFNVTPIIVDFDYFDASVP